jgi:hypothetical protein
MTVQLTVQTEADDYFKSVDSSSKVKSRALLLNVVVYGNPYICYSDYTSANPLRTGFHSVGLYCPPQTPRFHAIWLTLVDSLCAGDGTPWT